MSEILRVIPLFVLLALAFACYFLVVGALFARRVEKAIHNVKLMPGRSFGIGLVNFLFFGAMTVALFVVAEEFQESGRNLPYILLMIPTLLLIGVMLIVLSLGLLSMITILGETIFPDLSVWKKIFWATLILAFGSAIPIVGMVILFPYVSLTGFGAVILGFFQRSK